MKIQLMRNKIDKKIKMMKKIDIKIKMMKMKIQLMRIK